VHLSYANLDWRRFLARAPLLPPHDEALRALAQEPILITGAGGSIGSALALRLGVLLPPRLVLLEASESNLYSLERDWAAAGSVCSMTPILGSAADAALLDEIFATHMPRIVFHAAAFKHVPLMEEQPLAGIVNNIFATEILTHAATAHGARVVLLSTDKAVRPASVMGATKRVGEQIVRAAGGTVLRLANVLASRDSVAEIFARQIVHGGPITITDPEARRYFVTRDEAVDLLLTAASLPATSVLLAPVLPDAHPICDLARFMASELAPGSEIPIVYTGVRPGDKIIEELWSTAERIHAAECESLVAVETNLLPKSQLKSGLSALRAALDARDLGDAILQLRALVPDYTPSKAVLTLAQQSESKVCI
jgi:FlaA1/EpsC-like NDP-sugar epimerase